jgi:dephospho-CoA kinase
MTKKIVLVTGYKHSGKDTFSNILKNKVNGKIFKLADALRQMVKDFIGIDDETLEKEKETKPFKSRYTEKKLNYLNKDMSIRDLMIIFSEGLKQYYGKEIFCEYLVSQIKKRPEEYCIVSDLRYPYEAEYIKKHFSKEKVIIVRIKRKGVNLSSKHSSETSIDLIKEDILIENNGTIKNLEKCIEKMLLNSVLMNE